MAFHLIDGVLIGSDFHEYCRSVSAMRPDGDPEVFSGQRSRLAALPSALLSGSGIVQGMARAAVVSMAVIGGSIYLWGRALHSRLAGVAAVLLVASCSSFVLLVRTVSFYPAITAVFTLSGALCCVAMRWRSVGSLLLCGVGIGLCFLIDLRGLIWGLTALGPALLVVVLAPPKRWPVRLLALMLPIWLAWFGGRMAYVPNANPLEGQVDLIQRVKDKGRTPEWDRSAWPTSAYVWGRTDVTGIPTTLQVLTIQSRLIPDWMVEDIRSTTEVNRSVTPMVMPMAVALLLALLALRRRPLLALTLLGLLLPNFSSIQSAIRLGQLYPRYIASVAPAAAVVAGVAFASVAGRGRIRLVVGTVGLLVLVLGIVDGALSPVADWREISATQPRQISPFVALGEDGEVRWSHPWSCHDR